jgi:hypothetical protein
MRIFVVLMCSLALVCIAYAQPEQNKPQKKKQAQTARQGPPMGHPTGAGAGSKKTSMGAYEGQKGKKGQTSMGAYEGQKGKKGQTSMGAYEGQKGKKGQTSMGSYEGQTGKATKGGKVSGQGNVSPASGTTVNKSKTVNKNINVNKNYKVQQFNVSKNANPKYQAVKFNQNYHIAGAQNWHGSKYHVFVNYHPVWHDQWWWNSHYHNHVVSILGGWYFWNAGYWYPAWGYDPGAVYYFDGPIYASNPAMDPGQVVANVQAALKEQTGPNGEPYYQGEIDGILGPQTRAALADYQSAQGLEPTGAVDEPTLDSLGMA